MFDGETEEKGIASNWARASWLDPPPVFLCTTELQPPLATSAAYTQQDIPIDTCLMWTLA